MIYVLCAGLDKTPSKSDAFALEELLPFLTGERFARFEITRTTLRRALLNRQWHDFVYVIADNLIDAQESFVEAMELIDHCEELRFLVYRDEVFKLASGNRVYHIPKAAVVRFSGATSLPQAARLMDLVASELAYLEDLTLPTTSLSALLKTDAIVEGSRMIESQAVTAEYIYHDTKRQAHLALATYRLNLYAEQIADDEWNAEFDFVNFGDSLPVLTSCIFWDWLVENALKALVRLDDDTTARIVAGFPVSYEPLID
jgi:hypothetical protein